MAPKKKYKKLTNTEKRLRKEARERLIKDGLLPPNKTKLNRRKFTQGVTEDFKGFRAYDDMYYLYQAINWMLPTEYGRTVTPEQVGVLKTLRLAMDIKKFMQEKISQGETKYDVKELYDTVIAPVFKL